MPQELKPEDVGKLQAASALGAGHYMQQIEPHVRDGRWLGKRNSYRADPVKRIRSEFADGKPIRPAQLGGYVAASGPLHLWDGWTYLGLALDAHVRGSTGVASHLAYYAELRAAMALLSSQGVGIFHNRHCVIDFQGKIEYLENRPTHDAAWTYLEAWADAAPATRLLGRIIRSRSVSVVDWLSAMPTPTTWSPLGKDLLLSMGLDLRRFAGDRDARNEASYRPTGFAAAGTSSVLSDADFVVELVRLLEPGGVDGAFDTLDTFLFRRSVEKAFMAGTNRSHTSDRNKFVAAVTATVEAHKGLGPTRDPLVEFLTRNAQTDDPAPIRYAMQTSTQSEPEYHLQVLGRAMLLLRVATGSVRDLMETSSFGLDDLRFWWHEAGTQQGIWDEPPDSIDTSELWIDLDYALDDIQDWIDRPPLKRTGLLDSCGGPLSLATGLARVALMGLAT